MDLILLENIGDVNEDFPIHLIIVQHFKAIHFVRHDCRISKSIFLILPIPSILCNTHLPFQSLPNTQLSTLRMPNSVHCNESLAAQYHLLRRSFSVTGRFISSGISKYWGKRTVFIQFTEFSCSQYLF